jgi:hypothetical protein
MSGQRLTPVGIQRFVAIHDRASYAGIDLQQSGGRLVASTAMCNHVSIWPRDVLIIAS